MRSTQSAVPQVVVAAASPCVKCARAPRRVRCSGPELSALFLSICSQTASSLKHQPLSPGPSLTSFALSSNPIAHLNRIDYRKYRPRCLAQAFNRQPSILADAKNVSNTNTKADAAARFPQLRIN
ncbi:hypothetical protein PGT21_010889 [Puccinia graminis f. sp. tritici]|uniref:Uncharacterized protein n=1 Tax=Puccinia graminis f. sp. tritici TaxID=56615 RepID=A0A5B0MEP1_PUCGR|nr:hypothetical protein PGT21_010889 [Puccinia graminis f. sp. tritici]